MTSAFVDNVRALGDEVAALKTKAAMSIDVASRSEAMVKELWEQIPEAMNAKLETLQARLLSCEMARLDEVKKTLEGQQASHATHETKQNSMASRLDALECKVAGFLDSHEKQKQMLELQTTSHSELANQIRSQAAHHAALAQRISSAEGLVTEASQKNSQQLVVLQKLLDQQGEHKKSTSGLIEELKQTVAKAEAQLAQQTAQQAACSLRCKALEDRMKDMRTSEGSSNFVHSMQELQATIQTLRDERDASLRSAEQRFVQLEQSLTSLASEQSFQLQKSQRSFQEMQQQVASELNARVTHHTAMDGRLSRVEGTLRHSPDAQTGTQLEAVLKSIQESSLVAVFEIETWTNHRLLRLLSRSWGSSFEMANPNWTSCRRSLASCVPGAKLAVSSEHGRSLNALLAAWQQA